jgi:hypothetical protein
MFKALSKCCFHTLLSNKWQTSPSVPVIKINMYTDGSDDSDDDSCDMPAESNSLLAYSKHSQDVDDCETQYLNEEIDEAGLKMYCLDRIQLIQEDLKDPNLSLSERLVNKTNLNALNNVLTNLRLSEKIKLGSLQNSQYTDAVILQKQVVCNLAGQKEYSDLIRPVVIAQPLLQQPTQVNDTNTNDQKQRTILRQPELKNNISEPCLAV